MIPENNLLEISPSVAAQQNKTCETIITEAIVQDLLAQGLTLDQIILPGGGKDMIAYLGDDFDAPLDDFSEYM